MSIKKRLRFLRVVVIVAFIILTMLAAFFLNDMHGTVQDYADRWTPSIVYVSDMYQYMSYLRITEYQLVYDDTALDADTIASRIAEYREGAEYSLDEFESYYVDDDDTQTEVDNVRESFDNYMTVSKQIESYCDDPATKQDAVALMVSSLEDFEDVTDQLEVVYDNAEQDSVKHGATRAKNQFIVVMILMILLAVLIILFIYRYIRKVSKIITVPLTEINDVAIAIAGGDLNQHIEYESDDEFGELASNFNLTTAKLSEYTTYISEITELLEEIANGNLDLKVRQSFDGEFTKVKQGFVDISNSLNDTMIKINHSSDNVAMGAEQMASGAQALSQGSTEQASSVQELAATIHEISDHVNQTSKNADEAREAAEKTNEEVTTSNNEMQNMIAAMNEISSSSNKIGNIIKTIEDIAFQTNILALNAAVEAARAGSAGKGFAVVADEVRNLATKSAEAAQETTTLIQTSLAAVENGTRIADNTAQSLLAVVEQSNRVYDLINEISDASKEQATAISQVTEGISQISSVVQTSSATAEQSAASSEELASQAQILKDLVNHFKLSGSASDLQANPVYMDAASEVPAYNASTHHAVYEKPEVITRPEGYIPAGDLAHAEATHHETHEAEAPHMAETPHVSHEAHEAHQTHETEPAHTADPAHTVTSASADDSTPLVDFSHHQVEASPVDDEYTPDDTDSKY